MIKHGEGTRRIEERRKFSLSVMFQGIDNEKLVLVRHKLTD